MTDIYTAEGELAPRVVQALARKYPACLRDDFTSCCGEYSKAIMHMILELVTTHPVYSADDGEEKLWSDLGTVATTAFREQDEVLEAIETFLAAAFKEVPTQYS